MDRVTKQGVRALTELGFTGIEAEVYTFLLKESPATGYRIAAGIGKPAPNSYKAVESLAAKGAVIIDDGENRLCRAVPPEELLGRMARRFETTRDRAFKALTTLRVPTGDDRVYQLKSREQVFARARAMLARASEIVLIDVFPEPMDELQAELTAAAERRVAVCVKAYREAEVRGATIHVDPDGARVLKRWPGQWLNIVVDGAEHLLAFMESGGDGVYQAVWSGSVYISWVYHSALLAEWTMAGLSVQIKRGASVRTLQALLQRSLHAGERNAAGYRALMKRFQLPGELAPAAGRRASRRSSRSRTKS